MPTPQERFDAALERGRQCYRAGWYGLACPRVPDTSGDQPSTADKASYNLGKRHRREFGGECPT